MWRAMMLSLGLSLCLLGGEAIVVDRVVLANEMTDSMHRSQYGLQGGGSYSPYEVVPSYSPTLPGMGMDRRIFVPPEWAPWALLGAGALTFLYATSLPGGRLEE